MSEKANDYDWVNVLRVIATFGVIIIHLCAPVVNKYNEISNMNWWVGNVYDSSVRCSVPLFFMVSGVLLLGKDELISVFVKKRLFRIIPPFLFWSILYLFYDRLFVYENFKFTSVLNFFNEIKKGLFEGSHFHLWFVYTILGLYLFVPILRKWLKHATNNEILYFLVIWFVTLLLRINFFKPFLPQIDLVNFSGYLGYFVLGYYLNKVNIKLKKIPIFILIIGFLITLIGTYYLSMIDGSFNALFYKYLSPSVLMISIGVFLIIKNTSFKNKTLLKIISTISNNCYGVYLMHMLAIYGFYRFDLNWSFIHPVIAIPLVATGVLLISSFIISMLKKNKFTKIISG